MEHLQKGGLRETSVLVLQAGGSNTLLTDCHGYSCLFTYRMKLNSHPLLKQRVRDKSFFSIVFLKTLQPEDLSFDSLGTETRTQHIVSQCKTPVFT